ncbi:MAG: C25 family cysteine peptidase [Candidatus Omnitrophota bacterium]
MSHLKKLHIAFFLLLVALSPATNAVASPLEPGIVHLLSASDIISPDPGVSIDYLVISANAFAGSPALSTHLDHRASVQGGHYSVGVAYLVDIYAAYSGATSQEKIKAFIQHAYDSWRESADPSLKYVLLVGDADRGFSSQTWFLPTWRSEAGQWDGIPTSDHDYACLSGEDFSPEIAIGRFPIKTEVELETVVNKTINFETNPPQDENNWATRHLTIIGSVSTDSEWPTMIQHHKEAKYFKYGAPGYSYNQNTIVNYLNAQGALFVTYKGHSMQEYWDNPDVAATAIAGLTNMDRQPAFVIALASNSACVDNPYPGHASIDCVGEAFLKNPNGGAVSYFGATREPWASGTWPYEPLILNEIYTNGVNIIGDAIRNAKINYVTPTRQDSDGYHRKIFNFLGDPALNIAAYRQQYSTKPEFSLFTLVDNTNPQPGDQVTFTAYVENKGFQVVQDLLVQVYSTYGAGETLLGEYTIPNLSAQEIATIRGSFSWPNYGNLGMKVLIDPNNTIQELDEFHNSIGIRTRYNGYYAIHVDASAPAGGDGTLAHPFNTLEPAIAWFNETPDPYEYLGEIHVHPGVYQGYPLNHNAYWLYMKGLGNPGEVILTSSLMNSSPLISDVVAEKKKLVVENISFVGNSGTEDLNLNYGIFKNNIFYNWRSIKSANAYFDHNLFYDNGTAMEGADLVLPGSVHLVNNTMANNEHLLTLNNSSVSLKNNIAWDNGAMEEVAPDTFHIFRANYNDSDDPAILNAGTNNISADPLFINSFGQDYRLQSESPCINSGDPNSLLDPDSSIADLGSCPFDLSVLQPPVVSVSANPNPVQEGILVTLQGSGSDPDGGNVFFHWDGPAGIDIADPDSAITTFTAPQVEVDTAYNFTLTVTDNEGETASQAVNVLVQNVEEVSVPPQAVAQAVPDTIMEGQTALLNGSASSDDENIVLYHWQAPEGIDLIDPTGPYATFLAPSVNKDVGYEFILTVTDNDGLTDSDMVVVHVQNSTQNPQAVIEISPNPAKPGDLIKLDGSKSNDKDGRVVSYRWSLDDNSALNVMRVKDGDKPIASFEISKNDRNKKYQFSLMVTDNDGLTDVESVTLAIENPAFVAPVAIVVATPNPIDEKQSGVLDGSDSFDLDGTIVRYQWSVQEGLSLILDPLNPSRAQFLAPEVQKDANYTATLKVTDNDGMSAQASVVIAVKNVQESLPPQPPVAAIVATPNPANEETTVLLDGSSSSDPDGNIVRYAWTSLGGVSLIRDPLDQARVQFVAPKVDKDSGYTFSLKVIDNDGLSSTANVVVTIKDVYMPPPSQPPVAYNQNLSTQENVALNITLTGYDPEGGYLQYSVLTQPTHGVLSGTAPNLAYAPSFAFVGTDSFTFNVHDGELGSNTATVMITVNHVIPIVEDDDEGGTVRLIQEISVPELNIAQASGYSTPSTFITDIRVQSGTYGSAPGDDVGSQVVNSDEISLVESYQPKQDSLEIEEGESVEFSVDVTEIEMVESLLAKKMEAENNKAELIDRGKLPQKEFSSDRKPVIQWFLDGQPVMDADGKGWTYSSAYGDVGSHSVKAQVSYQALEMSDAVSWDIVVTPADHLGPKILGLNSLHKDGSIQLRAVIDDTSSGASPITGGKVEIFTLKGYVAAGKLIAQDGVFDQIQENVLYNYKLTKQDTNNLMFRLVVWDKLGNKTSLDFNVTPPPLAQENSEKQNKS